MPGKGQLTLTGKLGEVMQDEVPEPSAVEHFSIPKVTIPAPPAGDGNAVREGQHEAFKAWLEAIHIHGVGLLRGLPADPAIMPAIPEMIGPVRPSNFGKVFEVINRPDANSNAYTAIALAVHSDLSTREYIPGLQFLFCMINETTGGNSILADGFSVAEQLKQESTEFYEVLSSVPIPSGTKDKDSDYRYTAPVLEHDRVRSRGQ